MDIDFLVHTKHRPPYTGVYTLQRITSSNLTYPGTKLFKLYLEFCVHILHRLTFFVYITYGNY